MFNHDYYAVYFVSFKSPFESESTHFKATENETEAKDFIEKAFKLIQNNEYFKHLHEFSKEDLFTIEEKRFY